MQISINLVIGRAQRGVGPEAAIRAMFAGGALGDAWMPTREWCYTRSSGGVYEKVTTSGDLVARQIGMVNGVYSDQLTDTYRPKYIEGSGKSWLLYDGVDDHLVTPSIDMTGTNKVAVFAGVRKLSDATTGIVVEFSANADSFNGAWYLAAPSLSGANKFTFRSRGTVNLATASTTDTVYSAPISAVLTGYSDIAAPRAGLRINGSVDIVTTDSQGGGNYGNHQLFRGRRGGTALAFSGLEYGLIVIGKSPSAAEFAAAETYLNELSAA